MRKVLASFLAFAIIFTVFMAATPSAYAPLYYLSTLEVTSPIFQELNPLTLRNSPSGEFTAEIVSCGLGYPGDFPPSVAGNIALILRGELLFSEKVQNAAAAGAVAAVIYNFAPGNVKGTLTFVTDIPAVHISQEEGNFLLDLLDPATVIVHLKVGPEFQVYADIRPGSWPNPLQLESKGVLPVAIYTTFLASDFDVTTIDPETIQLTREGVGAGVAPIRWSYKDVQPEDGNLDLALKFKTQEVIEVLDLDTFSDGDVVELVLTGNLKLEFGGNAFQGSDEVRILNG